MSMEGINWGEINNQAAKISSNFTELRTSIQDCLKSFGDQLTPVWASGNAIKFGDNLVASASELDTTMYDANSHIGEVLSKAAQIYADKFQVANDFHYGNYLKLESLENTFKETVNGITGMNKTVVTEALDNFTKTSQTAFETFNKNLMQINIGIYDNAGAQQAAFKDVLEEMMSKIGSVLESLIGEVKTGIDTEIDNVELAKTQTTSTFNQ
jgi:hypothetical protein